MARRIRRIALTVAALLVAGAVVLVVTVRPGLQDDSEAVGTAWKPLVAPLATRYATLGGVAAALEGAGAADRDVTRTLKHALSDWELLRATTDTVGQSTTANQLEGLAARVRATITRSDRFKGNAALRKAMDAFDGTVPRAELVAHYNDAVVRYERTRDGTWARLVAALDGYGGRTTLQLATP